MRKIIIEAPLLPSYLFINIDQMDDNFNRISSICGFNASIRLGEQIVAVSDKLIYQLRSLCHASKNIDVDTQTRFNNGDKIEIIEGFFKGPISISRAVKA